MICSCKILTDKRVARSLCNSRACCHITLSKTLECYIQAFCNGPDVVNSLAVKLISGWHHASDIIYTQVSQKNDTDVTHCNCNAYQRIFVIFAEILLRDYTSEWSFAVPPLLTNVSVLPGERWTPEIGSLQSCCIPKTTLFWLVISSALINQF